MNVFIGMKSMQVDAIKYKALVISMKNSCILKWVILNILQKNQIRSGGRVGEVITFKGNVNKFKYLRKPHI